MPITALDLNTALIVVDLQTGIVGLDLAHPVADVVARSVELVRAFREQGLPVVLVNVAGTPVGRTDRSGEAGRLFPDGWTELIDALDVRPSDILITKHARSAFAGTGLTQKLRALGVTQVVVTGIATSSGVESTARSAHEDGFNVTLPIDAMTDSRPDSHEYSVANTLPRIAETGTTNDVIALLGARRS